MALSPRFTEILKSIPIVIFGCMLCTSLISFTILSIPVYIFRYLLVHRPKSWRPDLEQILDIQSSAMANDYFTKTAPRDHACATLVVQGHVTTEEIQSLVLKNWINAKDPETGELSYKRFRQYPERWLGFTFWKIEDNLLVDNHVLRLYAKEKIVTDDEIDTELEKLLNEPFPRKQSPWSIRVIENYQNSKSCSKSEHYSVIIIALHHCLTDGYGLLTACMEGLLHDGSPKRNVISSQVPKGSIRKIIIDKVTLSIQAFMELAHVLPKQFGGSPWLVPDRKKKWHQFIARTEPILLEDIKAIKNKFGGNLTSILATAVSAATYKMLGRSGNKVKSMLCLNSLPVLGESKRKALSNNMTAAIFDMPISKMLGPVQRLKKVDQILEANKQSAVPLALQYFANVLGSHFYFVCEPLIMNRSIPIGISNVPIPIPLVLNGKLIISSETVAGGLQGDVGLVIAAESYGQELRIGVTAEEGLMSREELHQFVKFLTQEINHLRDLTQNANLLKGKRY